MQKGESSATVRPAHTQTVGRAKTATAVILWAIRLNLQNVENEQPEMCMFNTVLNTQCPLFSV